jgi:hypothetical protein
LVDLRFGEDGSTSFLLSDAVSLGDFSRAGLADLLSTQAGIRLCLYLDRFFKESLPGRNERFVDWLLLSYTVSYF